MSSHQLHDIDRGWAWVAMVSVYLTTIINSIAMFMNGVIHVALLNKFKEGNAKTSLVGALNAGLLCILSPVCGILINNYSCRTSLVVGGIITSTGFAVCAFLDILDGIILSGWYYSQWWSASIGYAFTASGSVDMIVYYFDERRSLMISINFALVGVGMFFSAPLGLLIIDSYGLSSLFLILAGIYGHACVLGVLCKPSSLERKVKKERRAHAHVPKHGHSLRSLFKFSLIYNKPFLCFLISSSTWNFALITAAIHLPNYISLNGGTDIEIGWVMTAFAIGNTLGRVAGTICVSKEFIDPLTVHIVSIGLGGIIMSCFPLYSAFDVGNYMFSILLGLLCGCPNSLDTVLSIRFVGADMLSEATSLSYFFCGIGVSTGPVITGYLLGLTGSYIYGFVIAGLVLIIGCFFGLLASITLRNTEERDKGEVAKSGADKKPVAKMNTQTGINKDRSIKSELKNETGTNDGIKSHTDINKNAFVMSDLENEIGSDDLVKSDTDNNNDLSVDSTLENEMGSNDKMKSKTEITKAISVD